MRAIIQRVSSASVHIDQSEYSAISQGFLILLGIHDQDQKEDIEWLIKKITQLRVFSDADGKMNLSLLDLSAELLIVSQFTLFADVKKGNRPGFTRSAKPDIAFPLYEAFIQAAKEVISPEKVKTGQFGADMQIHLCNDGPVSIILDSQQKDY